MPSSNAVVRVLRACICGSDLWPYGSLPATEPGDRIGHEFLGVVEAVGAEVSRLKPGNVVVAPEPVQRAPTSEVAGLCERDDRLTGGPISPLLYWFRPTSIHPLAQWAPAQPSRVAPGESAAARSRQPAYQPRN
jgi:hypothetical protein